MNLSTAKPVRPSLGGHIRLDTRGPAAARPLLTDPSPTTGLVSMPHALLQTQGSTTSDTSPKAERLPSFRHISKIADAATQDAIQPASYAAGAVAPPSYPPPPVTNQSPTIAQQPYPAAMHMSMTNGFHFGQQNAPAGAYGDFFYPNPTSPTATFTSNMYHHVRRQSHPHLYNTITPPPPPLVSVPTNSSSGAESYSHHSSLSEAMSTARTTPMDSSADLTVRAGPFLPAPQQHQQAGQPNPGPWICEYPGCTASPFPTQYLLSSHATSHSSSRPHYCSIPGCPRAQGGKGFKRKNEMIRHGLTHDTPGYICPFCPEDKCHRYPRPDNLQRHVRVRHLDKDRDDPLLKEVLSQRPIAGPGAARGHAASASVVQGTSGSSSGTESKGKRRRKTGP